MVELQNVFQLVFKMSMSASLVILVVSCLRILFNKAPKSFSYSLWIFVVLRLIFPISFKSKTSILSITKIVENETVSLLENSSIQKTQFVTNSSSTISNLQFNYLFSFLWIIGIVSLLSFVIYDYLKMKKSVKFGIKLRENIFEVDTIQVPFILGIIKPKIYLPIVIDESKLNIILAHENYHIQRKDHLMKLISLIVVAIHWFNPLVWLGYFNMCKDMEMSCDEKVIQRLGVQFKQPFGRLLLDYTMNLYTMIIAFGQSKTKERIQNILNYKKTKFWIIAVCCISFILLIIPLLSNPFENKKNTK